MSQIMKRIRVMCGFSEIQIRILRKSESVSQNLREKTKHFWSDFIKMFTCGSNPPPYGSNVKARQKKYCSVCRLHFYLIPNIPTSHQMGFLLFSTFKLNSQHNAFLFCYIERYSCQWDFNLYILYSRKLN